MQRSRTTRRTNTCLRSGCGGMWLLVRFGFHRGHYLRCEEPQAALRFFIWHPAVLEHPYELRCAQRVLDVAQHLDATLGCSNHLRVCEHLREAARGLYHLRHLSVILVAFGGLEVFRLVIFVVIERALRVVLAPLAPGFHRFALSPGAINPASRNRRLGFETGALAGELVGIVVFAVLFPGLLWDYEHPHSGLRHDVPGFRRYDRAVHPVDQILVQRLGPNTHLGNLEELAVEGKALLRKRELDDLGRFGKPLARLAHRHPEPVEFDTPGATTEAERETAPLGHDVEHRNLFGDANRVVPGKHHDHRAETDALGVSA